MSEENAEIVREYFRRFFDPAHVSSDWAALIHPDIRMSATEGWPEQGPFEGREAAVRQFDRLFADFSEFRYENLNFAADSGGWVIYTWDLHAKGASSGLPIVLHLATACRIEDGMFIEADFRWTLEEALEAAGLAGSQK